MCRYHVAAICFSCCASVGLTTKQIPHANTAKCHGVRTSHVLCGSMALDSSSSPYAAMRPRVQGPTAPSIVHAFKNEGIRIVWGRHSGSALAILKIAAQTLADVLGSLGTSVGTPSGCEGACKYVWLLAPRRHKASAQSCCSSRCPPSA